MQKKGINPYFSAKKIDKTGASGFIKEKEKKATTQEVKL